MSKLQEWIELDAKINELQSEKRKALTRYENHISELLCERDGLISMIEEEMRENGVLEDIIEGKLHNYKICYQVQPERVVIDDEAVPDDMCRIKREPMKKEIKQMLQAGAKVNWARLERGDDKLTYKVVKK